jgi:hypothetical protein
MGFQRKSPLEPDVTQQDLKFLRSSQDYLASFPLTLPFIRESSITVVQEQQQQQQLQVDTLQTAKVMSLCHLLSSPPMRVVKEEEVYRRHSFAQQR